MIDWKRIDDKKFENISQDLIQRELNIRLEGFIKGKDGGIDLRH